MFISVRDVTDTHSIDRAKLQLEYDGSLTSKKNKQIAEGDNKQTGQSNADARDELRRKVEAPNQSTSASEQKKESVSISSMEKLTFKSEQPTMKSTLRNLEPYKPTSFRKKSLTVLY